MYKLMLIEDDVELSNLIREYLERYGYDVYQPNTFFKIVEEFKKVNPDLVLLDINLPYYDGFYVSKHFRKLSYVPIIMISARSGDMDQIMAMELGADDYITKPFTFELLHSKVKATIRRVYGEYATKDSLHTCIGDLCLDANALTLTYQGKKEELSKNEYKLLKKLMDHHQNYVSREELIEEVWDSITFVNDNTLTVNMSRIKQLLTNLGVYESIKSKRGVGYMFDKPVGKGNYYG